MHASREHLQILCQLPSRTGRLGHARGARMFANMWGLGTVWRAGRAGGWLEPL